MGTRPIKLLVVLLLLGTPAIVGCQTKEPIVDVEAPGVDVEVQRDKATGETEVNINRNP